MNAVSTREAIGSAVKASAAGNAIDAISKPSLSNLKTNLPIIAQRIQALDPKHIPFWISKQLMTYWKQIMQRCENNFYFFVADT